MLKLNASFSKKIPAGQKFSSKSYHASIEMELPDGLTEEQLKGKVHETFALVRGSVEAEINGGEKTIPAPPQNGYPDSTAQNGFIPASPRQLKYLNDLARKRKYNLNAELQNLGLNSIDQLSRKQCSQLIDRVSGKQAA